MLDNLSIYPPEQYLFDSLVPLPDGTSYNAYLIEGSEKTVLLDSVDLLMADELLAQLETVSRIDYVISQHAEQNHSWAIPQVLEKFPDASFFPLSVLMDGEARP